MFKNDKYTLLEALNTHLNLQEVKDIYAKAGLDIEDFEGDTKDSKIRSLIIYFDKQKRLPELIAIVKAYHPHIFEDDSHHQIVKSTIKPQPATYISLSTRLRLHELVTTYLSFADIQDICQDLHIIYENVPGDSLESKSRELISYCNRRSTLPDLIAACQQKRPDITWDATTLE